MTRWMLFFFRGTWELILVPTDAVIISYGWVFTVKYPSDRYVIDIRSGSWPKGYTQTYDIDYFETFSPVVRMNSIRILFSVAVNLS